MSTHYFFWWVAGIFTLVIALLKLKVRYPKSSIVISKEKTFELRLGLEKNDNVPKRISQNLSLDGATKYKIVGIVGKQKSNKSGLMNHAFGTNFVVGTNGLAQTTEGITVGTGHPKFHNTIFMDVEGLNSEDILEPIQKELGMDRDAAIAFSSKVDIQLVLFCLTMCDVLLLNWRGLDSNDVEFVKRILQEYRRIKPEVLKKKHVIFVVRDTDSTAELAQKILLSALPEAKSAFNAVSFFVLPFSKSTYTSLTANRNWRNQIQGLRNAVLSTDASTEGEAWLNTLGPTLEEIIQGNINIEGIERWPQISEEKCKNALSDALKFVEETLKSDDNPVSPAVYSKFKDQAKDKFEQKAVGTSKKHYRDDLYSTLDRWFEDRYQKCVRKCQCRHQCTLRMRSDHSGDHRTCGGCHGKCKKHDCACILDEGHSDQGIFCSCGKTSQPSCSRGSCPYSDLWAPVQCGGTDEVRNCGLCHVTCLHHSKFACGLPENHKQPHTQCTESCVQNCKGGCGRRCSISCGDDHQDHSCGHKKTLKCDFVNLKKFGSCSQEDLSIPHENNEHTYICLHHVQAMGWDPQRLPNGYTTSNVKY